MQYVGVYTASNQIKQLCTQIITKMIYLFGYVLMLILIEYKVISRLIKCSLDYYTTDTSQKDMIPLQII